MSSPLAQEIAKRRTFAIISHPDAGKTTLTEKLLLYGGAIQLAGSVKARQNQRRATSDWMDMEKERGISITSTVLQFEYGGYVLNLLDTPGHDDFSADTYRTLTAADSAVMLIDNSKGVETQTKKLFAVCTQRGIPIFTFVNKMDQPGKGPLELLEEVEDVLGIKSVAMNWPIGEGSEFKGVYDRSAKVVHLFSRVARGATKAAVETMSIDDPALPTALGQAQFDRLVIDIELLDVAGEALDMNEVLAGRLTPVYFGSAVSNFGVELFLRSFLTIAPEPGPRESMSGKVSPDSSFSGFVFKIQANMDPNHRDRIAFMRIVSGRFEKDMEVNHERLKKSVRLTRPQRLFAQDRETVEEAYAGDIVGLTNPGLFMLGDTVTQSQSLQYDEVPRFLPEVFGYLRNLDIGRLKQFEKGVEQLCQEGLVEVYWDPKAARKEPIIGVVGRLQFDVLQHRLMAEYSVKTNLEPLPFELLRWIEGPQEALDKIYYTERLRKLEDQEGRPVVVIANDWTLGYAQEQYPDVKFLTKPTPLAVRR